MSIEKDVQKLMEDRYGSVRAFAQKIDMPVSTLHTILTRGFSNSKTSHIIRIAEALNISADAIAKNKIVAVADYDPSDSRFDLEIWLDRGIAKLSTSETVLIGGQTADQESVRYITTSIRVGLTLAKDHLKEISEE